MYNGLVRRHRLAVRFSLALLIGLGIIAADAASARASMMAMACCAKTHGDCAGVKSPDDCCRGMGHVSAGPASNTPQRKSRFDSPTLLAELASTTPSSDSSSTPVVPVA